MLTFVEDKTRYYITTLFINNLNNNIMNDFIMNNVKRFDNLYSTNKNITNVRFSYKKNTMYLLFYNQPSKVLFTIKGWSIINLKK